MTEKKTDDIPHLTAAALYTLEGVAALEAAARQNGAVILDNDSPTGEMLVVTMKDTVLHKLPGLNKLLPERVTENVTVVTPKSFADYVNRFKTANTIAKASLDFMSVTAILDYHTSTEAGKDGAPSPQPGTHAVALKTAYHPDWLKWAALLDEDARPLGQTAFAEFVDDMAHTIAAPALAELLDAILHVDIDRSIKLKTSRNLRDGTIQLTYEELDSAGNAVGAAKVAAVPAEIGLLVPVFQGTAPVAVTIKLRYAVGSGHITFRVALPGLDKLVADEFESIVDGITQETEVPVYFVA